MAQRIKPKDRRIPIKDRRMPVLSRVRSLGPEPKPAIVTQTGEKKHEPAASRDVREVHSPQSTVHSLQSSAERSVASPKGTAASPQSAPHKREHRPFVETYDIPASYNTTYLTLLARDPNWIYAYWEVALYSINEMKQRIGEEEFMRSSHVLRMYDITYKDFNGYNANKWFDLEVGPYTNSWYINIWEDNVTYCGDIGIRTPDGRFFSFARSNFVTTPRLNSSGRPDLIWMDVKQESQNRPHIYVDTQPYAGSRKVSLPGPKKRGRKIYLTDDDIRAYYSKLFPVLRKLIVTRRKGTGLGRVTIKGSEVFLEDFLIGELTGGLSHTEFMKKIILGSSEELMLKGGGSKAGASEKEQKQRKFFFEIGCELIVYGRTEPDAEVWLGDKKIQLREDGTFSLRFALPDGKIPLDFVAISKDKIQKRRIKTAVEREATKSESYS